MDDNYRKRLIERAEIANESLRKSLIDAHINLFSIEALTLGFSYESGEDFKNAQTAYAIAYGLHYALGSRANQDLCDNMLRRVGVSEEELPNLHSFGCIKASKLIGLANMLVDLKEKPVIVIAKPSGN